MKLSTTLTLGLTLTAILLLGACAGPEKHSAKATDKLEPYECGTVSKLHTYKGVFLASQPSEADFGQAKKGGVKTVINMRHASENKTFDEAIVVNKLGLTYHNPAWNGPTELSDQRFDEVRSLLRSAERPILLHCSSANRVGPMWMAYRVLDEGASIEQAVLEAKTIGMKSPDYERLAKDYIARHKKG